MVNCLGKYGALGSRGFVFRWQTDALGVRNKRTLALFWVALRPLDGKWGDRYYGSWETKGHSLCFGWLFDHWIGHAAADAECIGGLSRHQSCMSNELAPLAGKEKPALRRAKLSIKRS
jgi:hypothetical protein